MSEIKFRRRIAGSAGSSVPVDKLGDMKKIWAGLARWRSSRTDVSAVAREIVYSLEGIFSTFCGGKKLNLGGLAGPVFRSRKIG